MTLTSLVPANSSNDQTGQPSVGILIGLVVGIVLVVISLLASRTILHTAKEEGRQTKVESKRVGTCKGGCRREYG